AAEIPGAGMPRHTIGVGEQIALQSRSRRRQVADERWIARRSQELRLRCESQTSDNGSDVEHVQSFRDLQLVIKYVAAGDTAINVERRSRAGEAEFARWQPRRWSKNTREKKLPGILDHARVRQQSGNRGSRGAFRDLDESLAMESGVEADQEIIENTCPQNGGENQNFQQADQQLPPNARKSR